MRTISQGRNEALKLKLGESREIDLGSRRPDDASLDFFRLQLRAAGIEISPTGRRGKVLATRTGGRSQN